MCFLFQRENLASSFKCSNVELICSACVKIKHNLSKECHMDGTGSSEINKYFSGAHVTVDSMTDIPPAKVYILAL